MRIIRIESLASGMPTEFDGQYVVEYDPSICMSDNPYDGGLLVTSPDRSKAKVFATSKEAVEYYRQSYGARADGLPNRPLTAFTVSIGGFD